MTRIGFAYNEKPHSVAASSVSSSGGGVASPQSGDDEFAEWDSPETVAAVESALGEYGRVIRLEADDDFPEKLRSANPDIVFNVAEGLRGPNRESHVPAICEFYGVPYTGSDPFTLSLCLDKARTKETLMHRGIATPAFAVVRSAAEAREVARGLRFPLFVKPLHEGSSKGVYEQNLCGTSSELASRVSLLRRRYRQPVLVEEFLTGDEFTCGVLGNGDEARVLPVVAIKFDSLPEGALPIYGYEAKWLWDRPENPLDIFECPARVGNDRRDAIEQVALAAYNAVGCRDWARVDVRLDEAGNPNILEINPLPGILPEVADNSCLPKAARAAGLGYDDLIQACLLAGARRNGISLTRRSRKQRSVAA